MKFLTVSLVLTIMFCLSVINATDPPSQGDSDASQFDDSDDSLSEDDTDDSLYEADSDENQDDDSSLEIINKEDVMERQTKDNETSNKRKAIEIAETSAETSSIEKKQMTWSGRMKNMDDIIELINNFGFGVKTGPIADHLNGLHQDTLKAGVPLNTFFHSLTTLHEHVLVTLKAIIMRHVYVYLMHLKHYLASPSTSNQESLVADYTSYKDEIITNLQHFANSVNQLKDQHVVRIAVLLKEWKNFIDHHQYDDKISEVLGTIGLMTSAYGVLETFSEPLSDKDVGNNEVIDNIFKKYGDPDEKLQKFDVPHKMIWVIYVFNVRIDYINKEFGACGWIKSPMESVCFKRIVDQQTSTKKIVREIVDVEELSNSD